MSRLGARGFDGLVARELIAVGFGLAFLAVTFNQVGLDTPLGRAVLAVATLIAIAAIVVRGWIAANRLTRSLLLLRATLDTRTTLRAVPLTVCLDSFRNPARKSSSWL